MSSISVSMHCGSGTNAIKNMADIKRCDLHNNRKYKNNKNQEIDLSLSQYNVTLVGTKNITEDIKEFYKKEFTEATYNYNKKQPDERRKIANYLDKMDKDSKSNIAVEFLFQVGDKEDWENKSLEDKKKTVEIFKKAIPILEAKGIKTVNASIHLDETSPHLHLIAVPIIENQKRGLEKQVSQNKVITKSVLNDIRTEVEKAFIEEYNKIYGTNKTLKKGCEIEEHLQVKDYKDTKKVLEVAKKVKNKLELKEAVEQDYKKLADEIKEKEKETKNLTNQLTKLEREKTEKKQDLEKIKEDIEKIDNTIEMYKNNIAETSEKIDNLKKEFNKLEDERLKKEKENQEQKERIEEQNRIRSSQETILKDLENAEKIKEERKKKLEELEKENKELNNKQQDILEKLENTEKSNIEKKKKLKEIEAENRDIQEKIENAESNKISSSNYLTKLENEMQDLDNSYSEEKEALDKLKTFKKTLHNLQKNDDYVIQAKFKKLEMFRNALSDIIDNVTEFAMNVKDTFKTIKNSLENALEENTLAEDINSIISQELKIGMEDFNNFYEEKRKDKLKDEIEEIKEIENEKDFF